MTSTIPPAHGLTATRFVEFSTALVELGRTNPGIIQALRDNLEQFIDSATSDARYRRVLGSSPDLRPLADVASSFLQGQKLRELPTALTAFQRLCAEAAGLESIAEASGLNQPASGAQMGDRLQKRPSFLEPPYFEHVAIPPMLIEELRPSFDTLPPDRYLKGDYIFRFREYALADILEDQIVWLPPEPFSQPLEINKYAGGAQREFAPLKESTKELLTPFVRALSRKLPRGNAYRVGIHQIQITADDLHAGLPAPEGPHQDGFESQAILVCKRENVKGAVTTLYKEPPKDLELDSIYTRSLEVGEGILFCDQRLFHYTSNIAPKVGGLAARGVFVINFVRTSWRH